MGVGRLSALRCRRLSKLSGCPGYQVVCFALSEVVKVVRLSKVIKVVCFALSAVVRVVRLSRVFRLSASCFPVVKWSNSKFFVDNPTTALADNSTTASADNKDNSTTALADNMDNQTTAPAENSTTLTTALADYVTTLLIFAAL